MRTESFHADDLVQVLRRGKIATMPQLKKALSDIKQGSDIAEGGHPGFERLGRLLGPLGGGHQAVDFAEVDLADDFAFAIDALAIAGVVIGVAVDHFRREARHT